MLRMIPGTLLILGTWLVILAVLAGIGLLARKAFGLATLSVATLLDEIWTGFGITILFLLVWNFWLPVGSAAAIIVLLAGGIGLWMHRDALARTFSAPPTRASALAAAAAAIAGLWVAHVSIGDVTAWDSALYHWQGVRWAREYPAVPGLANLFGPLGFNNSAFLFDALLDVGPWEGRSHHLAAGLLPFAFACLAAALAARAVEGGDGDRPRAVFVLVCLTGAAQAMWSAVPSYVTDIATTTVTLVLASSWYGFLMRTERRPLEDAWAVVRIVLLAALAVSLKLNMAVFGALAVFGAVGQWLAGRPDAPLRRKTLAWAAVVAVGFGTAWTSRGVILSGYPAFPSTALPAPVEWRVPEEHARAEFAYIVDSGRQTAAQFDVVSGRSGISRWLPGWLWRQQEQVFYIAVPLAVLAGALVVTWRLRGRADAAAREGTRRGGWMAVPLVIAVGAWFSVAPESRYASPFFWSLAALSVAQAFLLAGIAATPALLRRLAAVCWLVAGASLVVQPLVYWFARGRRGSPLRAVAVATIRVPPPGHWLQPRAWVVRPTTYTTRSGLVLNVPPHRCWDAPLPCTPNPAPNLRLRVPGRMERGFLVDGGWQMESWPQAWRPEYLPALRSRPGWSASATP